MRFDVIDEREAPPRPVLDRGGKRRLEMNELLDALEPGQVARIASVASDKADAAAAGAKKVDIEGLLLEAAAFRGSRVTIWTDEAGAVYARRSDGAGDHATVGEGA